MFTAAAHAALGARADRPGRTPFGVLGALADFGIRLAGALAEKMQALTGAGRSAITLASPYERLVQLVGRILAFELRLEKEAAEPKLQTPAAERSAKAQAQASEVEVAEARSLAPEAEASERRVEGERGEPRENLLKGLRLHEWADLPFDKLVALICKELQSIARALGDHPLVQEAKTLAAKVLRPPPPAPPPLPTPDLWGLPPDAPPTTQPRAPPEAFRPGVPKP